MFNSELPLVSVLMTAYNRQAFIAEAIESVLNSSYRFFELIIVDDCSIDSTVQIAKSYELKDERIKVYINDKNLGDYPNRNKAASYANGKYLKYLDSDDKMRDDCLEKMVFQMELHPECAFGISSRSIDHSIIHLPANSYHVHFFERGILDISPSGSIIRSDIYKKEKGFWELRCVSDFEFWLRIALKYPLIELEKDLIFWRLHHEQEIHLGNDAYLEHTISIVMDKIELSNLTKHDKTIILDKYKRQTMRYLIKNFIKLGFSKFLYFKRINKIKFSDAF
jgi:glycosyltransferase involved in cell wall biosynthesis